MANEPQNRRIRLDQTVSDDGPVESPVSEGRPWLIVAYGNDRSRHIQLQPAPLTIGRGQEADIVLDDDRVSKVHCIVRVTAQGDVEVTDAGSRNGTFVDGNRIERALLLPKSELRIGGTVLRMEHKDPAQVRFEEEMFRAAVTDPLTGVPNRRAFEERAAAEVARAQRHGVPVAAVFVDIDHFKQINDTHGHAAGDAVLRDVAQRIASTRRADDVLCRYGGEEFVLLLGYAGLEQAAACGERIRSQVQARPVSVESREVPVTVSVGVSAYRAGDTVASLLGRADAALYRAKSAGRNRVEREA
jgi:diguanylate cyclase (GGDEF)-like protein